MRFSACTLALVGAAALGADAQMPTSGTVMTTDMSYLETKPGTMGMFTVTHTGGNTKIKGDIKKLGDCVEGCGSHLHTGYDCDTAKGYFHYWDGVDLADPWPASKAMSDAADSETATLDTTTASAGANFGEIAGRVVLLHAKGGARTSCGKIVPDGLGETVLEADLKPLADVTGARYATFANGDEYTASVAVATSSTGEGDATRYTHTYTVTGTDVPEELTLIVGEPGAACTETAPEESVVLTESTTMDLANTPVWLMDGENQVGECQELLSKDTQGYLMLYTDGDDVKVSGHAIKLPMVGGDGAVATTEGMTATLYDGTCNSPGAQYKEGANAVMAKSFSSEGILGAPVNKDFVYPRGTFTDTLSGRSLSDLEGKAVVLSYKGVMLACGAVSELDNETSTEAPTPSGAAANVVSAGVLAMTAATGLTML